MEHPLLARIMARSVAPVVMVLSTSQAESACLKNNLSFVDLLRPFCEMLEINVPVRTASETPYRLQEFQLRLFYASEITQISTEAAEAHLLEVVTQASDLAMEELQGDPRNLEAVKKMAQEESLSSWYHQYCLEFIKSLAFSDHEAIDHPVACLFVVSSNDENPLASITELFTAENLPAIMKNGVMDPRVLKHYVVLHDNQDGDHDRANQVLQEIRNAHGFNDSRILCINSRSPEDNDPVDNVWSKHSKNLGGCLLNSDLDAIQGFVLDLCQKHIIPNLEQKVRILNHNVSATRKGLRNQIKSLWWNRKKDEPEVATVYTYLSMESQIRLLADYSFMLRDYELASSNYRLVSSDYKDRAMKRYAGAMEMTGVCLCLLDQSRREADSCMETAYVVYQSCGPPTARYAIRSTIWSAEIHKSRGQYREAANVLLRAATELDKESSLRAGVLLEQSGYCYLRCSPPMLRKYGFHLVLAGVRYYMSGQRKHAIRAYTSVLSVYEGQGWHLINDHLNSYLGRVSSHLGQLDDAVSHYMSLVASNQQSAQNQATFLREFLALVQNSNAKDKVLKVGLPRIHSESVYVHFEDQRTYGSSAAASLPEDAWLQVEEGLLPSTTGTLVTWLDGPKGRKEPDDFNVCVAGEDVTVSFDVTNTLQVPVEVASMELICEFDPKVLPESGLEDGNSDKTMLFSRENLSLQGGEKRKVSLNVKPKDEGLLRIVGVKWSLFGIVHGQYDFETRMKPKKAKSGGRTLELDPHQRLKFRVGGGMPKLEVSLHELPHKLNTGEIRRIVLEVHNSSNTALKNIKLKTSHQEYIKVGEQGDLDLEFPNCLEWRGESNENAPRNSFPQEMEAASTFLWPLWLHARHAGEFALKMVLYFEAEEATSSFKYRTLRMTHSLQVIPSLDVSVHISPCPVKLDTYLLRMDVANAHPSESFWLRQASCVDENWRFSAVQPQVLDQAGDDAFLSASVSPSQLLPSGQSSSFFFQIQRRDFISESHPSERSCSLGPSSSKEPVIDVHSGPLFYFHQQERTVQRKKRQDLEGHFVDIILIAEQQDDTSSSTPSALQNNNRFASHHICHCRVEGRVPLVWALEGPSLVEHNFDKQPLCEIPLMLALRNCSSSRAMIKVETIDVNLTTTNTFKEEDEPQAAGWRNASPPPTLDALASPSKAAAAPMVNEVGPCGAYVWRGPKSVTTVQLEASSCANVPLCAAVVAAGTYDVCSYRISWKLLDAASKRSPKPVEDMKGKISRFIPAPATRSSSLSAAGFENLATEDLDVALEEAAASSAMGRSFLVNVRFVN